MINTLYISTVGHKWTNSDLLPLNKRNLKKVIANSELIDVRTSVEDLSSENITVVCDNAACIVLVGIDENTQFTNDNFTSYGLLFRSLVQNSSKLDNFDLHSVIWTRIWQKTLNCLRNFRTTDTPVLWTAGCSITSAVGVDQNQRWGTLLSEYLELPEVSLSRAGTSIYWSADQILRSDIRPGDTVVWGLTNLGRFQVSKDWDFNSGNVEAYYKIQKEKQYWTIDYFRSETDVLVAIRSISQVINFCQKIQAHLYLVNFLDTNWLGIILQNQVENFIDMTIDLPMVDNIPQYLDIGTDNLHPGPLQHKHYAEQIFNLIKEDKHGKTI